MLDKKINPRDVLLRVSSKHLALASPYFRARFEGSWKPSISPTPNNCLTLFEEDWDTEAFLILMNVIHGRTSRIPHSVSLELLAKIAVLVDYYKCPDAIKFFSEVWIGKLCVSHTTTYSRDLVLWIIVSWVFQQRNEFEAATKVASMNSKSPIQTLGLPIPSGIVGKHIMHASDSV